MFAQMKVLAPAAALAASILAAPGAQAAGWILGLVDGKSIVTIDPATRKVTGNVDVKGAGALIGIDVRPADGMLYGVTGDGMIVTIDAKSGQATMKSKMSEMLKSGAMATVDFNPVADRLRVMGSDGSNLRVNVDDGRATVDGAHKYKEGDANAGKTPKIVAGAYTNAWKGTQATALYAIDTATNSLVMQAPPNDGVLNTVGALGIALSGPVAFNIVTSQPDKNEAWLVTGGALHAVDLKTGKATMVGKIEGLRGALSDIAWHD
jgi:uncharacterized protein DUF4394